jgi:hypothetical protein
MTNEEVIVPFEVGGEGGSCSREMPKSKCLIKGAGPSADGTYLETLKYHFHQKIRHRFVPDLW